MSWGHHRAVVMSEGSDFCPRHSYHINSNAKHIHVLCKPRSERSLKWSCPTVAERLGQGIPLSEVGLPPPTLVGHLEHDLHNAL